MKRIGGLLTEYCDFYDLPVAACSHCNPADVESPRRQSVGEKADNSHARDIFKAAVLELRRGAVVRDSGTATQVTVDGTRVWVKATLEADANKTSFQFHDGEKMLSIDV